MSFKEAMMPAASAGETCDKECGRSAALAPKLPDELAVGVAGWEEPGELPTDGGYHESVDIS